MISGEIAPFIEAVDFTSKRQLMYKLHRIEEKADTLRPLDRQIVGEMVAAALCEIAFIPERELLRFKRYVNYKKFGDSDGKGRKIKGSD